MSLKPLLDRLKRTDAPTVEDAERWDRWWLYGVEPAPFLVFVRAQDGIVYGRRIENTREIAVDNNHGEWTPLFSPVESRALAALPLKVAEMAIEMSGDAVIGEATDPGAEEYNDGLLDASRAVRRLIPATIIEECAK